MGLVFSKIFQFPWIYKTLPVSKGQKSIERSKYLWICINIYFYDIQKSSILNMTKTPKNTNFYISFVPKVLMIIFTPKNTPPMNG